MIYATGQKQLLNVVFEVGEEEEDVEVGTPLQHTATAWKYRARITVEQFFRQFQLHVQSNGGANSLPVLQLFCDQVMVSVLLRLHCVQI